MNEDVTVAPDLPESRVGDGSEAVVLTLNPADRRLTILPMSFSVEGESRIAAGTLDDSVADTRVKMFGLAICTALVGLILAFFLDIL